MMWKLISVASVCFIAVSGEASAACSTYPYTLNNGTTADATQVMANFNCAALTDGPIFSGNIGIGTSSPDSTLAIYGNAGGGINAGISIKRSGLATEGLMVIGSGGELRIGTANYARLIQEDDSTGNLFFNPNTNPASSASLTILQSGNVGINTTSPNYTLHVNGSVAGTSAYNNLSDRRLKKNIRPITGALAIIEHLSGIRFDWKARDERTAGKAADLPVGSPQVGFIAQDLEKVLPEAVSTASGREALKSVAESKVVPVLVQAVKELKAANDSQKAAIHYQQSEIQALRKELTLMGNRAAMRTARN